MSVYIDIYLSLTGSPKKVNSRKSKLKRFVGMMMKLLGEQDSMYLNFRINICWHFKSFKKAKFLLANETYQILGMTEIIIDDHLTSEKFSPNYIQVSLSKKMGYFSKMETFSRHSNTPDKQD